MTVKPYTEKEWIAEAVKRFGENSRHWKFKCPICGIETTYEEWVAAGAEDSAAFACIGRFTVANRVAFGTTKQKLKGPCNYTGGGLFRMNPVHVLLENGSELQLFDFAS